MVAKIAVDIACVAPLGLSSSKYCRVENKLRFLEKKTPTSKKGVTKLFLSSPWVNVLNKTFGLNFKIITEQFVSTYGTQFLGIRKS
jgi:hypothetical protein